jgi:glycogen operon protein
VSLNQLIRGANKEWHGVKLNLPDWGAWSHSVALTAEIRQERLRFHLILNAYWEALDFELPPGDEGKENTWRRWVDTALDSPYDIVPWQGLVPVLGQTYRAGPRSVVVLFSDL